MNSIPNNGIVTLYTIGHSRQPAADFMAQLESNSIELLIDVRSHPRSRFAPWSNASAISEALTSRNIAYEQMGAVLGGHPDDGALYDLDDHVVYERIASRDDFRKAITAVVQKARGSKVALMCTEENPTKCHRQPLLATALRERGVRVLHIRRSGAIVDAEALPARIESPQLPLLEPPGEDTDWRSPKRIPHRRD